MGTVPKHRSSIFALGDVINRAQLTPVAIREAMAFTEAQFSTAAVPPVDYDLIPHGGLLPAQYRHRGPHRRSTCSRPLAIYEAVFRRMKHTLTGQEDPS